jgi:hypothetical protein
MIGKTEKNRKRGKGDIKKERKKWEEKMGSIHALKN